MWRNNQYGRTMLETLAVMAVIGMLGKGILSLVSSLYDKYKVSVITTQIKDLQDKIRLRYSAVGDYADLGDATKLSVLFKDNVIPVNMRSGDKVIHAFNGAVVFNEDVNKLKDDITGGITKYSITFKDIEAKACFELLSMSWTVNETSDLYSIFVEKEADEETETEAFAQTYTWGASNSTERLPLSIETVGNICSSQTNITWVFQ